VQQQESEYNNKGEVKKNSTFKRQATTTKNAVLFLLLPEVAHRKAGNDK
jgi:hypothetical protein